MATDPLERAREEFLAALAEAGRDAARIEAVRVRFAGRRSGLLRDLEEALKTLPREAKPAYGKALNELKRLVEERLAAAHDGAAAGGPSRSLDVTLPGRRPVTGALHPVTLVRREIEEIFLRMGYSVADGPEIELDWYNFEALNIGADHPARDMQDTFYVEDAALPPGAAPGTVVLRTQTSPVQIRAMKRIGKPPVRVICPGRVYRSDYDQTHAPMFHQVEGLCVDEGITFADLKGTLAAFARAFFGPGTRTRFRPSYFPFVEPGAEVDVSCSICGGTGEKDGHRCGTCKGTGWLEVLGAGMVHPKVLENGGMDPARCTGFAFGMGVERLAMLRYGIDDLRLYFENDLRFLQQF